MVSRGSVSGRRARASPLIEAAGTLVTTSALRNTSGVSREPRGAVETQQAPAQDRDSFNVFINYRREDSAGHAGRLYDALSKRFGDEHVFMDVDAIDPGEDFTEVVERKVGSCDVLIALIGRSWVTTTDREGRRRLDKPHDWVRQEIQTALERRDTRVIPALVQGAEVPAPDELPEPLRKLSHRNAVELRDARWGDDVGRLIKHLESLAGPRAQRSVPLAETAQQPSRAWPPRLVPVMIGAGILVLAAVAAAVLLLSGGGSPEQDETARWVRQTDALLFHSANTRGDLNGLIQDVEDRAISRELALSRIDQIIGQRRNLRHSLPVDPPQSFRRARELLHGSIVASLRDDEAVKRWIRAVYGRSSDVSRLSREWRRLSVSATSKKEQFLSEYNALRQRELDLPPINPAY
jgi:TIR domain-containing protein